MRRYLIFLLSLWLLIGCTAQYAPPSSSSAKPSWAPAESVAPQPNESHPSPSPLEPETPSPSPPPSAPEHSPKQARVDAILSQMTAAEKVGQLFFVRCPQKNAPEDVSTYHLGGYLLFGRDFRNKTAHEVSQAILSYQSAAKIPLLIGVDEEGGSVARVSSNPDLAPDGRFPSPQELYTQGGMEAITADAAKKSTLLLQYGINVNFSPVADISTDPDDFIYPRTLGQDAQSTAEYTSSVVKTMEEAGIGSVLKHFPGYGDNLDTHTGIALDQRPMRQFQEEDFLPFQSGISAGADSVLVSHNIIACMDHTLPASLSPEVHKLLREELGFSGVILTDDLAMDAVAAYAADGSAAVLAVLAGNDMIVTTDYATQIPQVIQAVEDGQIPTELLDQSVRRILGWKYDLGLLS